MLKIPVERIKKNCGTCGKEFVGLKRTKYCCGRCYNESYGKNSLKSNLNGISAGTIGAISEIMVSADLMKKGYEVYRAISPASHCDLIAIKDDEIHKYEVRTGYYNILASGEKKLTVSMVRMDGKELIVVTHSDNKIHYL